MRFIKFGKIPKKDRLRKIVNSHNYKNGEFKNLVPITTLTEGSNYYQMFKELLFNKSKKVKPPVTLPSIKTNLHALDLKEDVVVWFGHSSYFIQIQGKRILIDPVISGNASPIAFTMKSYKGSDIYKAEDIPEIDYLFITHDHWDHLDYETLMSLKRKIKCIITGLGTGSHLESWGFEKNIIIEKDWFEEVNFENNFSVCVTPSQHFSGRLFRRNKTQWVSFVIKTSTQKIFISGDTGYGSHFKLIGEKYGPFDLTILECGQYNKHWQGIHMMPEQTVQAALDLKSKKLLPSHWSKFTLSLHDWDEPIRRAVKESNLKNLPIIHPLIGEIVYLNDKLENIKKWWEQI